MTVRLTVQTWLCDSDTEGVAVKVGLQWDRETVRVYFEGAWSVLKRKSESLQAVLVATRLIVSRTCGFICLRHFLFSSSVNVKDTLQKSCRDGGPFHRTSSAGGRMNECVFAHGIIINIQALVEYFPLSFTCLRLLTCPFGTHLKCRPMFRGRSNNAVVKGRNCCSCFGNYTNIFGASFTSNGLSMMLFHESKLKKDNSLARTRL